MPTDLQQLRPGYEVRLSPFKTEIAIITPGRDPWCVRLDTMHGEHRPTEAVAHWTRLVPAEGGADARHS